MESEEKINFGEFVQKFTEKLEETITKAQDNHNEIICDKLQALSALTGTIHTLVTIVGDNHNGHGIFVDRILDTVSSISIDADNLRSEIRRDIQEELS